MTTIINGSSPSITFSDSTTQTTAFTGQALSASPYTTSLGASTLVNNTGASNTAIGNSALANNTTASRNTAVGYQSIYNNTTGTNNIGLGYQAGYGAGTVTGTDNIAIGVQSLYQYSSGTYNVAIGTSALQANTTASYNTAVGYQAGYNQTTNANGVYIGSGAYYSATGGASVAIGYNAGYSVTSGYYNCFVGYQSGNAVTTGTRNTILGSYSGNQGSLDIRTASNRIVLSDGDGNPRQYFDSDGFMYVNQIGQLSGYTEQAVITSTSSSNVALALKANGINIALATTNTSTSTYNAATFCNNGDFSGSTKGSITVSNTGTTYVTTSDYRLKENIAPMTGALNKVNLLKPVTYTWKDGGEIGQGFIAHELQAVVPDAVTGEKDAVDSEGKPVYQGIDTSFLVATLTAAIQELKAEFDAYKATHP